MDAPSYADATRTAILIYSDAAIGLPSAPWRPYDREASRAAYLRRVERKVRVGITVSHGRKEKARRLASRAWFGLGLRVGCWS